MRTTNLSLFKTLTLGLVISLAATSCKDKDEDPEPAPVTPPTGYTVPTTYNFTNVNYSGQTTRMMMLDSISEYMKRGNTQGVVLDAAQMKNMYANSGSPFSNVDLDASGKQLKNKVYSGDQVYFDNLFDSIAMNSQSVTPGSNGVAGVVTSGTKKYLFNAKGIEFAQIIKKQMQSAVFYYQAVEQYLTNLPTVDNTTVTTGQGTVMEHNADEAFGYFGVPLDFPTNVSGLKYWGDYANKVNPAISCNATIMNAFLKLRAAVSNKDNTTRDAQIVIIKQQWERIAAASVIYELKQAKLSTNFSQDAVRMHYLSEGLGFLLGLKYNSAKQISDAQIASAVAALGDNFYTISTSQIDNAINAVNTVYGFDLSLF